MIKVADIGLQSTRAKKFRDISAHLRGFKEREQMATRKIVHIDEEKCNGCGDCVPSCAEGAIRIIDGKAKLVADVYCDGLGACLGHCPQDAIKVMEREAEAFDEAAVAQHLVHSLSGGQVPPRPACPSTRPQNLQLNIVDRTPAPPAAGNGESQRGQSSSTLGNWPIQLHLVPPAAPFLQDRDLVLAADCTAFASPDLHQRMMKDRALLIGCPKLDDSDFYVKKLAAILLQSNVKSVRVVHMEVPCCTGLVRIAEAARSMAGRDVPLEHVVVSVRGELSQEAPLPAHPV
jgi:ferredoxin